MDMQNPRIQLLKAAGHRLTKARLTLLAVLEAERGHLTSSQALEQVEQIDPSIGRASVFRTLDLFTRLGIVRPTYINTSLTPTYVLLNGGHHHHIICGDCQTVFEFEDCGLEALAHDLESALGVQIDGHLLEFYGTCADCQSDSLAEPQP